MDKIDLERIKEDLERVKTHCKDCEIFLTPNEPKAIDTVNALIQDMINNKDYGWE